MQPWRKRFHRFKDKLVEIAEDRHKFPQINFVQMYHEVNYVGKFYEYKYKSRNSNWILVVPSPDGCTIIALPEHIEVDPRDGTIGT